MGDHESVQKSKLDDFLQSMTFSSAELDRSCDCNDCDELIPVDIRLAIQRHKRLKVSQVTLLRTQDRTLVVKEDSVSIWKWTMPLNAEPLIEYGNNHRIVFVDRLPKESMAVSIGKGVLGSKSETQGRCKVEWSQGNAYFIKSNGGKALGWLHTNAEPTSEVDGHAVIYNIKIFQCDNGIEEKAWVKDIHQVFARSMESCAITNGPNDKATSEASITENQSSGLLLSAHDSNVISNIITTLVTSS